VQRAVGSVRFVRATGRLDECVRFYRDLLGLAVLAEFRGHEGYDGVVFGLPDAGVQLELVHPPAAELRAASAEDQLVFYLGDADAVSTATSPLHERGLRPVSTENPYWNERGAVAFEDPDGFVVIFAPFSYT
jgi:catechol 2,3-dioxygenase-like lactoylglutathione lyase family enzyme